MTTTTNRVPPMTFAEVERRALTTCGHCHGPIAGIAAVKTCEAFGDLVVTHRYCTWNCYVAQRQLHSCEMCGFFVHEDDAAFGYPDGFYVCSRCDIESVMRQYGTA